MRELNVCEVGAVAGGESYHPSENGWGMANGTQVAGLGQGVFNFFATNLAWEGLKVWALSPNGGSGREGFGGSQNGGNDAHDGDSSHGTRGW